MPNGRLVSGALLAALVALVGTSARAQLHGFKIPKLPKHVFKCSEIDGALVDKFLKGRDARNKVLEQEAANANQAGGSNAEAKEAASEALDAAVSAKGVSFSHSSNGHHSKADKAERDASGMDDVKLAGFVECCIGALHDDAQVLSQMPKSSLQAILDREGELSKQCK